MLTIRFKLCGTLIGSKSIFGVYLDARTLQYKVCWLIRVEQFKSCMDQFKIWDIYYEMRILTLIERLRLDQTSDGFRPNTHWKLPAPLRIFYKVKRFFNQCEKWPRHGYPPNSDYFLKWVVKAKTLGGDFMYWESTNILCILCFSVFHILYFYFHISNNWIWTIQQGFHIKIYLRHQVLYFFENFFIIF